MGINVDGSGIGFGGNGFSGLGGGGGVGVDDPHLTVERRVVYGELVNRNEISYQGSWSKIVEKAKDFVVGGVVACDLEAGEGDTGAIGAPRVSTVTTTRGVGGVSRTTVVITQNRHVCSFGVDWTEVSKPIRTWHADRGSGAPDLERIRTWEAQKEGSPASYYGLKIGNTPLDGDTRKLASFIAKGIETYSRYAPVVTVACNIESPERVGELYPQIGAVSDEPPAPNGWTNAAGKTLADIVNGIGNSPTTGEPYEWLLVKSQITQNGDGTFAWNICWQGADSIERDLYTVD